MLYFIFMRFPPNKEHGEYNQLRKSTQCSRESVTSTSPLEDTENSLQAPGFSLAWNPLKHVGGPASTQTQQIAHTPHRRAPRPCVRAPLSVLHRACLAIAGRSSEKSPSPHGSWNVERSRSPTTGSECPHTGLQDPSHFSHRDSPQSEPALHTPSRWQPWKSAGESQGHR